MTQKQKSREISVWSVVRHAVSRAERLGREPMTYEETSAKLDEIARQADDAIAAYRAPAGPSREPDTSWLLETHEAGYPQWWTGRFTREPASERKPAEAHLRGVTRTVAEVTDDPQNVLRFARAEDAELARVHIVRDVDRFKPSEHMWPAPAGPSREPDAWQVLDGEGEPVLNPPITEQNRAMNREEQARRYALLLDTRSPQDGPHSVVALYRHPAPAAAEPTND